MPAELWEDQYELSPADALADGFVFGTEETGYLTLDRPVHTGGEVQALDTARPYEDGTAFGRDYRGSKSVTFTIGVLTDARNRAIVQTGAPLRTNLDFLDYFEARWTDPALRNGPNSIAMLRTCEGGRTSRAYGRPRRYEEAVGRFTDQGYTPVACDFMLADNTWYEDEESVATASLAVAPDGGFEFPATFPLTMTGGETQGLSEMVVGGTQRTWPIIEFRGPVLYPAVTFAGMTIALDTGLAYDQTVVVDTRPWKRTVLRQADGASYAGWLSAKAPSMRDMAVKPGLYQVRYSGNDATGTSRCTVRWRNARSRP